MACPFRCIYCDQQQITGVDHLPARKEVVHTIETHLQSFPRNNRHVEIAFFGGNFTGLRQETQQYYLSIAKKYLDEGKVHGIRLSTRPDFISTSKLELLKSYGVSTIELGAQSLDDEVLEACGRGHQASDVEQASSLIKEFGFRLGLQMMIGLPGDDHSKAIETARKIIGLGSDETRIYPCLIVRDTKLHRMFENGQYSPLTLESAVQISADLLLLFEANQVKVIRIGLHASDDLNTKSFIAGPMHPAFKTMVLSEIWSRKLTSYIDWPDTRHIVIDVPKQELNFAVGFNGANKLALKNRYAKVMFRANKLLTTREFKVHPMTA
jgi:histone acetyltransferase (RNA polymerase elongator complex component)